MIYTVLPRVLLSHNAYRSEYLGHNIAFQCAICSYIYALTNRSTIISGNIEAVPMNMNDLLICWGMCGLTLKRLNCRINRLLGVAIPHWMINIAICYVSKPPMLHAHWYIGQRFDFRHVYVYKHTYTYTSGWMQQSWELMLLIHHYITMYLQPVRVIRESECTNQISFGSLFLIRMWRKKPGKKVCCFPRHPPKKN